MATTLKDLGIKDVICLDTEYIARDGELVTPVCICAKSLITGESWKIFADDVLQENPFPLGDDVLYVGFAIHSEWSYFLAKGWDIPSTCIDLYAEEMMRTSADTESDGRRRGKRYVPSLLRTAEKYGLDAMSSSRKDEMRTRILMGFPFFGHVRTEILDYCMQDAELTGQIFRKMLPTISLKAAIRRGRFARVVAEVERNGIPIDRASYEKLRSNRDALRNQLVAAVEQEHGYGVYQPDKKGLMVFKESGFNALVARLGLESKWPKTPTGKYITADGDNLTESEKIFKEMAQLCPYLEPLRQTRKFVTMLRGKFELFVGSDDHSRLYPNPWWTETGRCNPTNSNFCFTLPKCVRPLIKPTSEQAIAYVDLKSAEIGIAAGLSRDPRLMEMYQEAIRPGGQDCYIGFAKLAKAIPPDGTKKTHPKERALYKTAFLATQYGQGPVSMARRNNLPLSLAKSVIAQHKFIFAKYWQFINNEIIRAQGIDGTMSTGWGWKRNVGENAFENSLKNFPIQAGGAEILRQATVYMVESGLKVGALVHDAVLILDSPQNIEESVATCQACFRRASLEYMDFELGCDSKIILYPSRWGENGEEEPEDFELWLKIQKLLNEINTSQQLLLPEVA